MVIAGNSKIRKMCSHVPRVRIIEVFADLTPEEEIMDVWVKYLSSMLMLPNLV